MPCRRRTTWSLVVAVSLVVLCGSFASASRNQAKQDVLRHGESVLKAIQAPTDVDLKAVAQLLAAVCRFSSHDDLAQGEQDLVRDANILIIRAVWVPALAAARETSSSSAGSELRAENHLRLKISEFEKLAREHGVPESTAAVGRLYLATFQYNQQRISEMQQTLYAAEPVVTDPSVWPGFCGIYWNLRGLLATVESNYERAFECHRKALFKRRAAGLMLDQAETLNNLGYLLIELGDFEAAKSVLTESIALYERLGFSGEQPPGALTARLNLAKVIESNRDYATAAAKLESLLNRISQGNTSQLDLALTCRNNLALVNFNMGNFEESERLLNQCRRDAEEVFRDFPERRAEIDVNLGCVAFMRHRWDAAERYLERALRLFADKNPRHHRIAETKSYLARVALEKGDTQRAGELLNDALHDRTRQVRQVLESSLSQRDRLAYVQKLRVHTESIAWPGVLDTYLDIAPRLGIAEAAQYPRMLAWKGILAQPKVRAVDAKSDRIFRADNLRWVEIRRRLRVLAAAKQTTHVVAAIAKLENEASSLERSLHQQAGRRMLGEPVLREDVLAALPEKSALLDVMEIRRFQFRNQGQKVTDDRAYVAFLIRKDTNKIARIDLGNQHKIDTAIRQLVQRLANYEPSELQAEKVDRLVIGKLRKRLAGVQLLLLAGDGMFNHLPLAVLPGTDRDYWIDEMAFAYVPSVRELVERRRPQSREAAAPAWGKKATSWLVVGDVDYGERQKPHVRLPDTAEEARFVDEVFSQLAGVPFGKEFADGHPGILMGIDPDRTTVQRLLRSRNYVHLATHGFFRQRDVDAYAIRGVAAQLDSALVLQGANDDKSGLDSLLTAEEIANLDLKHVQLVVLSACETGLGHVQAGQGTLGLVGSLQQAGVRTVLGALWKVESKATVELMKAFYRQLLARKSDFAPAFALRAAQLEMLANERYFEVPSLWAAWTVNGDPGDLPSTDR